MSVGLLPLLWDARRAKRHGPTAITVRQRTRLAELTGFVRANSPLYREAYRDLPDPVEDVTLLPAMDKKRLMARFDQWSTDREVTSEKVRAFIANRDHVGERFLGKYFVATTSGSTGAPGVFVLDDRTLAVSAALLSRGISDWLGFGDYVRIVLGGIRMAMVVATGAHFAGIVTGTLLRKRYGERVEVLAAQAPLPELIARLNQFRPAIFVAYGSVGALLASEQEAGRLRIKPVLVVLTAEGLPAGDYERIARAFQAKVRQTYISTEATVIAYSCQHDWLHVSSDWLILEPVDANYQPVPPGEQSHTVLVTNLANRLQPVLRYDLGDSILVRPGPCPCGNPLPAIRVQGRAADTLTFSRDGAKVSIPPLVFEMDHTPGVDLFQLVQTTPTSLRVRLRIAATADPDRVWRAVEADLARLLAAHDLEHVTIERGDEPPVQSFGGKYRPIIPLRVIGG
jgi:phenylacetate-CoA ligase